MYACMYVFNLCCWVALNLIKVLYELTWVAVTLMKVLSELTWVTVTVIKVLNELTEHIKVEPPQL